MKACIPKLFQICLLVFAFLRATTAVSETCSTIDLTTSPNCMISANGRTLTFNLEASVDDITIPTPSGPVQMRGALVYNNSLDPERLELRRGDELKILYSNNMIPADVAYHGIDNLNQSNLHTHGLVTSWDFTNSTSTTMVPVPRGDNVLDDNILSSTSTDFLYQIRPDHPLGLNWYHPHPHMRTGIQVQGGMAGLLLVGDRKAEDKINPIYLSLKDMQSKKLATAVYQFEKFSPPAASACFEQTEVSDGMESWKFVAGDKYSCTYDYDANNQDPNNPVASYRWFFTVNGEVYPHFQTIPKTLFRLANNSANVIYRLSLIPHDAPPGSYVVPAFRIIEKDGMTIGAGGQEMYSCILAVTPATRVAFALDFKRRGVRISGNQRKVCDVTVSTPGLGGANIDVSRARDLQPGESLAVSAQGHDLVQIGIDTGEDDWPPVLLARIHGNPAYSNNMNSYLQQVNNASEPELLNPLDVMPPQISISDCPGDSADRQNRNLALWFGESPSAEFFGIIVDSQANIEALRDQYLQSFSSSLPSTPPPGLVTYTNPPSSIVVAGGNPEDKIFNSGRTDICTTKSSTGSPEIWRIYNLSAQIHNFHIHQMKFRVLKVQGSACSNAWSDVYSSKFQNADITTGYVINPEAESEDEQCLKSYSELFLNVPGSVMFPASAPLITAADLASRAVGGIPQQDFGDHDTYPIPPMGYIELEMAFNLEQHIGEYVYHCHILEHEDQGMMGKIVVFPQSQN